MSADSDAVLDWLKNAPALRDRGACAALEARLRRDGLRDWRAGARSSPRARTPATRRCCLHRRRRRAARRHAARARRWPTGCAALRALLEACGQWAALVADAAGAQVIAALRLDAEPQATCVPTAAGGAPLHAGRVQRLGERGAGGRAASCRRRRGARARWSCCRCSSCWARAVRRGGAARLRRAAAAGCRPSRPAPGRAAQRAALGCRRATTLEAGSARPGALALADAALRPALAPLRRQRRAGAPSPLVQALAAGGARCRGADSARRGARDRAPDAAAVPRGARCRWRSSRPAPTKTCAAAPTASSRCASSACASARRDRRRGRQARLRQLAARRARRLPRGAARQRRRPIRPARAEL